TLLRSVGELRRADDQDRAANVRGGHGAGRVHRDGSGERGELEGRVGSTITEAIDRVAAQRESASGVDRGISRRDPYGSGVARVDTEPQRVDVTQCRDVDAQAGRP